MTKKPERSAKKKGEAIAPSTRVGAFLDQVAKATGSLSGEPAGRLIFALDATMSREAGWRRAREIQKEMFLATDSLGGLAVQMAYFRGLAEFRATDWLRSGEALARAMMGVTCQGGHTQIRRVLSHALQENKAHRTRALVYVGDCCEEDVDALCAAAGELGLVGVRAFMFHEGEDVYAGRVFREIARLTNGAYCPFDWRSADRLKELLAAAAVYAAGGARALTDYSRGRGSAVAGLLSQLR